MRFSIPSFRLLDPTGVSEGVIIAGTVASVAAAAAGGVAANNAANYQAQVAQNNAKAANDQAAYQNQLKQIQLEQTLGKERAAAGAAGVVGGSLQDVEYNTLVMGKYDQLATTYEGKVASTQQNSQAQLDEMGGENAMISGGISAAGSALKGAGKYETYSDQTAGYGAQPDYSEDQYIP